MSLKSIEMQVAIPRTIEASKLQEQLQQRGQLINSLANDVVQKEAEKKRTSVMENEKLTQSKLEQSKQEQQGKGFHEHSSKRETKNDQHQTTHPYKGTMIDYSG
ncbi:hypothetical protein [Niallia sp. Krafla_26]|uniref:hypothetical protein n=1 Tax=Niallia sp. Krafla_26 TaxID=3064703 RepID=UPI003D17FF20